jgi:uracil-DNA glycosylase family 4
VGLAHAVLGLKEQTRLTKPSIRNPKSEIRKAFAAVEKEVVCCRRCPRLVEWRQEAAKNPPRRFRDEKYWARPVPAFGDIAARVLLVGLAPAAHGGNRTGRMFTGDESGNFLFRTLHAEGFSSRSESVRAGDGLALSGALLSAACRCAPPENRPTPREFDNCREYLAREISLLPSGAVLIALGALAFEQCLKVLAERGEEIPRPRPRFTHGARYRIGSRMLLASYHPSQQNTFTRKLTQGMLRAVLRRARQEAGLTGDE